MVKRTIGDTIWQSQIVKSPQWSYKALDVIQNAAGEIFVFGEASKLIPPVDTRLFGAKFSADGVHLWTVNEGIGPGMNDITSIKLQATPEGGCAFVLQGYDNVNQVAVSRWSKRSNNGALEWMQPFPSNSFYFDLDNIGNELISVRSYLDTAGQVQAYLERYDEQGSLAYSSHLNPAFGSNHVSTILVVNNPPQSTLVLGLESDEFPISKPFVAMFDTAGNLMWKKNYFAYNPSTGGVFVDARPTPDHGFIIVGTQDDYLYAMKIDSAGLLYPVLISGQIALDANVNCLTDSTEAPLANWVVQVVGNEVAFATTDESGFYTLGLPAGDHEIQVIPPSDLWEACPIMAAISVPDTGSTSLQQNFALTPVVDCPAMTVSLSTPFLRRCFENTYLVRYCNDGTVAADSVEVEIYLDPALDFNSASISYTQDGDVLRFALGSVGSLDCGSFTINVTPNCAETSIGQTICLSASVYPDTFCNPPANWSGATLVGSAACEGDSVRFVLKNEGNGPSTSGLNFIVVDDHVIMMQAPLPSILPQDEYETTVPSNGDAWRFLSEQEPNHPNSESISVGVEGCNGPVQPGLLLEFPNTDGRPATARDCQELVGSWDPNDKSAAPRGVGDAHYIRPGTPLTYHIRFQNTGTDTAFTIVVRDTLATWLDPATLRPGASSHPYSFALSGNGTASFVFNNIALPDSNVSEINSHGFVEFSIDQKADIPLGTVLENRAGIYFDFNPVVLTNTVWHTVEENFLAIASATHTPVMPANGLDIYPNPSCGTVWIAPSGKAFAQGDRVRICNTFGELVADQATYGARAEIKNALPAGVYFIEWTGDGKVKGRGKMVRE